MKLESIVTLADSAVRLRFLAMERSLRAHGSQLPLRVIPYRNDRRFDLPVGASWWEMPKIRELLKVVPASGAKMRYQCLTIAQYHYVDADICFLRNVEQALAPYQGFVVCCGHWRAADHAVDATSREILAQRSTLWQRMIFNSGQFACDRALYNEDELVALASSPAFRASCLDHPHHDQPGLNLLVAHKAPPFIQLTLPPYNFESSWAGDYEGDPTEYWHDKSQMPYLMHWAGMRMDHYRAVHQIFLSYLTVAERKEWEEGIEAQKHAAFLRRWNPVEIVARICRRLRCFRQELGVR